MLPEGVSLITMDIEEVTVNRYKLDLPPFRTISRSQYRGCSGINERFG